MKVEEINLYEAVKQIDSTIKILGGPNGASATDFPQLDTVDANEHETFTLEEFRMIILDCRKKNKDFIIARVTTPDPYNQTIFYNFYYAASEINRVLFRFESDRRLLHRMKVRNPLNNMFILGQVYYYKVPVYEVDKAIVDYFFLIQKSEDNSSRKAFSAVFRNPHTHLIEAQEALSKSMDCKDSMYQAGKHKNTEGRDPEEIIEDVRKGMIKLPNIPITDRKVEYSAKYFASDDDFLMQAEIREYFRKNTLDADDDFLFEIDRAQNDFFALLDTASEEENDEVMGWKRLLSAHVSMLIILLGVCLLLGTGPQIVIIALPLALFLLVSFIGSIFYILFCRRGTFDTLAVNSVEDV